MENYNNIYITASCTISNQAIFKDDSAVFSNPAASVNDFLIAAYHHFHLKYPKFYKMDGLAKLGWLATEILVADRLKSGAYQPADIGIVLANASASLDTDMKYFETTKTMASPALFVYTLPNIVIGEISIRHGCKGEHAFFVQPHFDAEFMIHYVKNLFQNNLLQCCICGWVEILDQQYKTVLFLIEKQPQAVGHLFTTEHLNNLYNQHDGYINSPT